MHYSRKMYIKDSILNNFQITDFLEQLDSNKEEKTDQIKRFCADSHQDIISNFKNYYEVKMKFNNIESKKSTLDSKLLKVEKSNQYDIREINSKRIQLRNLALLEKVIQKSKLALQQGQKALNSAQNDKLTSSIRQIDKFKGNNFFIYRILAPLPNVIYQKVKNEADLKIQKWIIYSKQKANEIGTFILQNQEANYRPNALASSERQSIVFDNSQSRTSIGRSSLIKNPTRTSIRQSILPQQTRTSMINEQVPNFRMAQSMRRISNRVSIAQQKDMDFKIEFSSLKQPQFIYETMKQKDLFTSELKTERSRLILEICENEQVDSLNQTKQYFHNILGFFYFEKEIGRVFKDYMSIDNLIIDCYKKIEKQIKIIYSKLTANEILVLKKDLHILAISFHKMEMPSMSNQLMKLISTQFQVFCRRNITQIKLVLNQRIQLDGFNNVRVRDDYDVYAAIFELGNKFQQAQEFPFSQIVQDTVLQINQFIENCIQYLQGLTDYDQNIIQNLDTLYIEISDVIKIFLRQSGKERDPLQLCQLAMNIFYLEKSMRYYRKQIESYLQVSTTQKFQSLAAFQNVRHECEEAISSTLNARVMQMLQQLGVVQWDPNQPNQGAHDFIEMLIGLMESLFNTMNILIPDFVQPALFLTYSFINDVIWKIMVEEIQCFNILGIVNLKQNIDALIQFCRRNYNYWQKITECLREILQLIDLFLVDHPSVYLEKRKSKYMQLQPQKLVVLFGKYKKIKHPKYPVVRRSDLKSLVKKIQQQEL